MKQFTSQDIVENIKQPPGDHWSLASGCEQLTDEVSPAKTTAISD